MMLWGGFVAFVLAMLALDLFVINRRPHLVGAREATVWTGICIGLALAFNVLVYFIYEARASAPGAHAALSGGEAAEQFFAGWLVEYALSLDNILVIAVIFRSFRVPPHHQHRVLFWGILGALVMRAAMILAGTTAIQRFEWVQYILGGFLVLWSAKMLIWGESRADPEHGWVVRLARRFLRITPAREDAHFFGRLDGRRAITPLFLTLLVVETTDVVFAVDSIPAILGITRDPFLVYSSNVFAILGLRSAYFALAAMIDRFRALKSALIVVLAFVGVKMLIGRWYDVSTGVSLAVIGLILGAGLIRPVLGPARRARAHADQES